MAKAASSVVQANGFDLKNERVELVSRGVRSERTVMTVGELESMRTESIAVPASKHGLEAICGASCETGAL